MADEELDAALVERVQRALCVRDMDRMALMHYEDQARAALLSLPIPAAALNALARGEAVVVPNIMTAEMKAVAGDLRQFVHYLPPEAEKRPADLEIYEPKGEAFERAFKAACAASPYAAKE
jgi:hypothetical protein